MNTSLLPSGDQRGPPSRGPPVNRIASPPRVGTIQISVSYPSFLSLTWTRTYATREPSGEICGSAIHTKRKRSCSVMTRFSAAIGLETSAHSSRQGNTAESIACRRIPSSIRKIGILPDPGAND
ncbi:MAG: hypothetical protein AUG03_03060 [Acidobacteria bacterium 13_1_20CM_2_68_14]|nr:MAG: hypothetical protein AUG03_03060 [Acidobacteria bacterium 13_1_20CM_2_68_14]